MGTHSHHGDRSGALAWGWLVALAGGCIWPGRARVVDPSQVVQVELPHERRGRDHEAGATQTGSEDEVLRDPALEEPRDRSEGSFCRATRPVLQELRGSVDRHARCTSSRYVEAGYFGTTADIATSSFHNACFAGSASLGEEVEYVERPIPKLGRLAAVVKIGAEATIDLSRYGVRPATYVLESPRGVTGAAIEVWFDAPVVRAPTNLAATLAALAIDDPRGSKGVAASCLEQLCTSEAVYTRQIVSARPRIHVVLEGGVATGLRPTAVGEGVSIEGDGQRFTIRPASRVNLAASFQRSRSALGDACIAGRKVRAGSAGLTPPCATIIRHGIHTTLEGCVRNGRTVVTCRFELVSPGRDRTLGVHVTSSRGLGSTLVDEKGSSHFAHIGNSGSVWEESELAITLVADAPAFVSLEFRDVDSAAARFSRVRLSGRAERDLVFDFRGVEVSSGSGRCREGGAP